MLFSSIFNAIFIKFHGQLSFLGQTKKGVVAHAKFEGFSVYRAGYTRKMPPNPCTYTAVLKIVVYEVVHKVLSII